jgi:hypothetical protein
MPHNQRIDSGVDSGVRAIIALICHRQYRQVARWCDQDDGGIHAVAAGVRERRAAAA